jgi:hypothetical protein
LNIFDFRLVIVGGKIFSGSYSGGVVEMTRYGSKQKVLTKRELITGTNGKPLHANLTRVTQPG